MNDKIKVALVVIGLIVFGWLTVNKKLLVNQNPVVEETPQPNPVTATRILNIGSHEMKVEVRKTEAEQALGLSYRDRLDPGTGMAFVYTEPQKVMYWMKGMNFPLDFIWVARGIVVELTEGVVSPTEDNPVPKTVVPSQMVDMVIEVNAGYVLDRGVAVGDSISFK